MQGFLRKVCVAAGSSAGANLVINTVLRTGRRPRAAGLFSPAVDLRAIGDSYVANDGRDPLLTRDTATKLFAAYLGATPTTAESRCALVFPVQRCVHLDCRLVGLSNSK